LKQRRHRTSVAMLMLIVAAVTFFSGPIVCFGTDGNVRRVYAPGCLDLITHQSQPGVSLVAESQAGPQCYRCTCVPVLMLNPSNGDMLTGPIPSLGFSIECPLPVVGSVDLVTAGSLVYSPTFSPPSFIQERSVVLLI
jgi:hypothetical protein